MNELIPKLITRCRRRSIALIIDRTGELLVRAPLTSSEKEIYTFINKKADWIIQKKNEVKAHAIKPIDIVENGTFYYLGKKYIIKLKPSERVAIKEDNIFIPILNSKEKVISWLKTNLKKICADIANKYATQYGFNYANISITSAKTCWGSCSGKNRLNFTYKLALCPIEIIEYIVIHELCHTIVKNHSVNFWKWVKTCCLDYKIKEKWLKDHRQIIDII